ncbi:MAG: nitroreductase family protein [Verrucomicrobiales bacterium]
MPEQEQSIEAVNQWIRGRRTWKPENMDQQREVPQALLDAMFVNANWAPTHGLTEPWRFKLYRGEARQILAERLQQLYSDHTPPGEFRPDKHTKLGSTPLQAPVVILICMHRQDSGKIPEIEELAAVACAVQNMHLTASAAGLGAKWSSPPICYHPAINAALGLADDDRCLGLFYVGWPAEGAAVPVSPRRPAEEKVEEMG